MKTLETKTGFGRRCLLGMLTAGALICGLWTSNAFAAEQERQTGFVQIAEGRELYVDYIHPAPGRPTVVLLNGLTYSTYSWELFTRSLHGHGLGILRYDPIGMGQTLLKYGIPTGPVNYKDQTNDLRLLLDRLGVQQPVHVVGLSYGGALALQFGHESPERVASLIIMAPFIAPLQQQDNWIRMQVQQTRLLNPWNRASYDELYDYFLHMNIVTTYPIAEPVVLENAYKLEATFRMVQGIRKFLAKDISKFQPNVGVHLMIARRDQYIDNSVHDEFWETLQQGTQVSRLYIEHSEHKIPEAVPTFAANWVRQIVDKNPSICCGQTFVGNPWTNTVTAAQSGETLDVR